ncbi:MAG: cupin domain-containing protein [Betaproteobacteria bacterium]|nr:cupin domain-containing protein [Betaproteobacteria bacterium]MDH3438848.1 cupin domain-containing protein [Betaproteobacteria bacterium]
MGNFINFSELLKSLAIAPSTANEPVKRMFICDGAHLTANIAMGMEGGSALHTQPGHDEIIIVLEGEAEFQVGKESKRVGPGDMVFIPQNTLHGRVRTLTPKYAALSIYAPFFDRSRKKFVWHSEA